ncbi:MAG TPA: hypothetical protein VIL48_10335 [Acidimicrobiales bacterium]
MTRAWVGLPIGVAITVMMVAMVSSGTGSDGGEDRPDPAAGGAPPGAVAVHRAVEATAAVERACVELQTVYTGLDRLRDVPPGVDRVRTVQRAAFDRPARRARAESDMSELATVLETADAAVPGDYSLPTRFVVDGETVYAQIGPMARAIGLEPTSWIRRDLAGFADQSVDNETAALLLDPLGMVGLLARPVRAVETVGAEEVRGVATERLTVTVDLRPVVAPGGAGTTGDGGPDGGDDGGERRAGAVEPAERSERSEPAVGSGPSANGRAPADRAPADDRVSDGPVAANGSAPPAPADPDELGARFQAIGVDELPVDVWIDGHGVVRRIEFHLAAGGAAAGRGGVTTTFELYDVGDPGEIAVPDAADVVDQAELPTRLEEG